MEIYHAVPLPWDNSPTFVIPSHIDDSVPAEEEFQWAVQGLQGHGSVVPSLMHAKHLQEWLQDRRSEEVASEE